MSATSVIRRAIWSLVALPLAFLPCAHADIYRWDNGQVIPGTEGITPKPGVQLDHRQLEYAKLGGWTPAEGMDLTGANFEASNLTHPVQSFHAHNANLTGAVVTGTSFGYITSRGFTAAQLYSTQSYQAKDLRGIGLGGNDLTGWDFSGQNLTNAGLYRSTLTSADLTGAIVTGTDFSSYNKSRGFTAAQLYSTQSYQLKDLSGIGFWENDLTGWDFSGQNLTNAQLGFSTLTSADLTGGDRHGGRIRRPPGFTAAQLYSTQSYQAKDLSGIGLEGKNLTGWDFHEQNLTNADWYSSTLTNADLTGANLKNACLRGATLTLTKFSSESVYNQWTEFPAGFNPKVAGLTKVMSPEGDLDADDALDAADVDMLANKIGGRRNLWWLPDAAFDMNSDSVVSVEDHRVWVKDLAHTWYGDADLDGEFNSSDFVQVFQAGTYETTESASWSEGDWNGDGIFDSNDFVIAFQDGGYEQGPRTDVAAVPEPGAWALLVTGLALRLFGRRTRHPIIAD